MGLKMRFESCRFFSSLLYCLLASVGHHSTRVLNLLLLWPTRFDLSLYYVVLHNNRRSEKVMISLCRRFGQTKKPRRHETLINLQNAACSVQLVWWQWESRNEFKFGCNFVAVSSLQSSSTSSLPVPINLPFSAKYRKLRRTETISLAVRNVHTYWTVFFLFRAHNLLFFLIFFQRSVKMQYTHIFDIDDEWEEWEAAQFVRRNGEKREIKDPRIISNFNGNFFLCAMHRKIGETRRDDQQSSRDQVIGQRKLDLCAQ